MRMLDRGTPMRLLAAAWNQLKDFSAVGGDATYIWPRWLILRAVGLVYVIIFAGIIEEGRALIGPDGIFPIRDIMADLATDYPNPWEAFFRVPSLFWFSTSLGMIATLQWVGLASAVALVFNVWPRMALFGCWLCFLSFVSPGIFFAATQPDQLMIEVALLCIPLAPAGLLPGLAAKAAPRRIAVFALRWMFFRLMLEAGLAKFVFGTVLWRDGTAMDVMYETAPFPTILGYALFHLPHFFHFGEVVLTFLAEIPAPILAVFGGRRWRWFAFWSWVALQLGIQLTTNFGWLNVASIALGLVLLDDQMLASALRRVRGQRLAAWLSARVATVAFPPVKPWARWGLRVALGVQFVVAVMAYVIAPPRIPPERVPAFIYEPVTLLFSGFRSANSYPLFGNFPQTRHEVEFIGSNDGGETWRSYEFRYKIQGVDRVSPFVAPWYPRFEAILQNTRVVSTDTVLYQAVAAQLLQRNPRVIALFKSDPFGDRPATMIRMPDYRLSYHDLATRARTGDFWRKEYSGDYAPLMYLDGRGEVIANE
jgi:hypothetical protein